MSQPENRAGGPSEAPLDPEAERIQAKLKRLLFGSTLVMVLGLVAVFAAILYKINSDDGVPVDAQFAATVAVGADAEVLQANLSDGLLLVLVREGTKTALLRYDPVTGKQLGRTDFVSR